MWFTDSKSPHWLSWMTIFLFMALHIKIIQIYNCRIIEKFSFPAYCHPVGSSWNVSSIKTLLSTPTGFIPHQSSPPAVNESSYCSPGSHFWCREKTAMVAMGTWFFLIHSPLLGYFQSIHPHNQALNLDLTTPLLEEQSMIPHVFYFTYRFLRLRLKIFHSLVQTRQESLLLTVYLECWLCNDLTPIHRSSSVIDCFRIVQS